MLSIFQFSYQNFNEFYYNLKNVMNLFPGWLLTLKSQHEQWYLM